MLCKIRLSREASPFEAHTEIGIPAGGFRGLVVRSSYILYILYILSGVAMLKVRLRQQLGSQDPAQAPLSTVVALKGDGSAHLKGHHAPGPDEPRATPKAVG